MTATYLYYSYIIEDLNLQTFFHTLKWSGHDMDKQLSIEVTTPFLSLKKERAAFHPLGICRSF